MLIYQVLMKEIHSHSNLLNENELKHLYFHRLPFHEKSRRRPFSLIYYHCLMVLVQILYIL